MRTANPVIWEQVGAIPFSLGALLFYVLLYRSRLVPRWLSGWGLAGAVLYLVPPLASMSGLSLGVLMGPLAVQEMVMALWLIGRGFDSRAIAPKPVGDTARWRSAPRTEPASA